MPYLIGQEELDAIRGVLESNTLERYVKSDESVVSRFEKNFCKKLGIKHTLAVSSGTGALICALKGLQIGIGDEVIIPSLTYVATALAVLDVGAIPVIAEIDESLTIDPIDLEKKITSKTRAIIPVHMYGLPCNMDAITNIAEKHDLRILEDVAQACGGSYKGKNLGTIGDAGIFSFNHYKILSVGEGGGVITNNDKIYQTAAIKHHGGIIYEEGLMNSFDIKPFAGSNFRLAEVLGAMLEVQLSRLDSFLSKLRAEKAQFLETILDFPEYFKKNHIHDKKGDCGTTFFLIFNTVSYAEAFIKEAEKLNVEVWSAYTKGHVYSNWEPIFKNQKVLISSDDGTYHWSKLKFDPSNECPKSMSILKRTVGISTKVTRSKSDFEQVINKYSYALNKITSLKYETI
ncbi:MAG: DegT/DnrJ/EryC1/StrS family aminotransferase [Bacteroidetes bacterium]|nr:DegT/DnrJ/EryC1/StrS family aminotransferase [Bacteroidota bacterium]